MVLFNYSTKEITAKIVYYGPGLCGKTTNLQFIYENLPKSINKGKMLSLATKTDRTLFFDFLPIDLGTIRGMRTRLQLYTVPGQVFYNTTRKLVLKGADGIVFVADSQKRMIDANLESFKNLEENLIEHGMNLSEIPLIIQFNKRDLPEVATVEELNAALNKLNVPIYEAVATTGIGVHETLKAMTRLVLNSLKGRYAEKRSVKPSPDIKPAQVTAPALEMPVSAPVSPRGAMPPRAPVTPVAEGPVSKAAGVDVVLPAENEPVLELVDDGLEILEDDNLLEIDDADGLTAVDDVDVFAGASGEEAVADRPVSPFAGMESSDLGKEPASPFAGMESSHLGKEPASPFAGMESSDLEEEPASPFAGMESPDLEEEPASPFAGMESSDLEEEPASPFAGMKRQPDAESASPLGGMGAQAGRSAPTPTKTPSDAEAQARRVSGNQEIMLPIDLAIGDKSISFQLKISLDIAPGGDVQVAKIEGGR